MNAQPGNATGPTVASDGIEPARTHEAGQAGDSQAGGSKMSIPAELEALTCLNPDDLNDYLEKILARLVSASEDPVVLEYQPLAASSDAAADLHALS